MKDKRLQRKFCWTVKFEFFYVKQTCNPDYKLGDQPIVRMQETILFTESEDPFLLAPQTKNLMEEWTYSNSLGSQRIRILEIQFVGVNEEYVEIKKKRRT